MSRRDGPGGWVPDGGWLAPSRRSPRVAVILLATALAAVLRFVSLGDHPLWIDEFLTWRMLRPDVPVSFWEQVRDVYQTPLTIALLWPLSRGACSELLLRLPAAICATALVPVGAVLAGRLAGRRTGEWTALLLAVSPFLVWYGQDARGYSPQLLLTLAATLVLVGMLRDGPRTGTAVAYGLLAGLAVLANNSALFLIAAHALTVLLLARPSRGADWGRWLLAFGLAGLVCAPWVLHATGVLAVDRLAPGAATGEPLRYQTTFTPWAWPFSAFAFVYGFSLGPSLDELREPDRLQRVLGWLPLLAPAALAAGWLVLGGLARLRRRAAAATALWILVPLLAVSLLALRNVKPFNVRYLAVAQPFVLMLLAHGASRLRFGRVAAGVVLALVLVSLVGYYGASRYAREDLRAAAETIAPEARDGDVILAPMIGRLFEHYYRGEGRIEPFWDVQRIRDRAQAREILAAKLGDADRAWLVLNRSRYIDPGDHLPAALGELGEITTGTDPPGVRIFAWRRAAAPDTSVTERRP